MGKIMLLIAKSMRHILRPAAIRDSKIDKTAKVCPGSNINFSRLERYSYIGNDCYTYYASIGSFCSIGDNCKIGAPSHTIDWVSTSPVFSEGKNVMKKNFASMVFENTVETIIGNDVWLGAGVLIKSGITVGDGAVIGMGSVVTKNVGPYEIWAGNPAKLIRKRFDDETIAKIKDTEWWNWDEDKLREYADLFSKTDDFLEKVTDSKGETGE